MNILNKFWTWISNIGITEDVSIPNAKRIRLTNRFGIVSILFTLPYIIGYAYYGLIDVALFSSLCCIVYFSIPIISSFRLYTLAKIVLFVAVLFHQFVLASFFGEKSEVHIIYIALILLPIVLFEIKNQQGWILFCIFITILATIILYQTHFSLLPNPGLSDETTYLLNIAYKITAVMGCFVILFSVIMISEKTEKSLDQSNILLEEQFQSIFNTSYDALFLVDSKDRKIVKANKRAVELFEMEKESDFYSHFGLDFHKEKFSNERNMRNELLNKGFFEQEILYRTKKGNEFWGALAIRIIFIENKKYQSVRVTDISHQKLAEKQIQASLNEKEILLSEIHHRVKNNLAVISGLLGLQSAFLEDEKAKEHFEESRNRIHSMALIHDKLYQNETSAKINFSAYINDLVEHIKISYASISTDIQFAVTCNDIFLDIKNAVPCGLILNELVSNAFKHAFKDKNTGEIKIVCTKMGEKFTMMVSDNGVGYDFESGLKSSRSLGLTLISALSDQINGKVKTTFDKGTSFYISFEA